MSALRITHTAVDGTLLEGSSKGDGAWDAIKAAQKTYRIRGWKYFPSIRMIGVMHSRDRAPQLGLIDVTADVLRDAGFEVEVAVDATPRAMEEAEADRAERMDDRAEALHDKADRKSTEADARHAGAQRIADGIPMGQPILVGHHSERRHRADMRRIDNGMRAAIALEGEAASAADRAASAEKHMQRRENPRRVARRVETLEAERRGVQRNLDGYVRNFRNGRGELYYVEDHKPAEGRWREQQLARAADLDEKIRYWKAFLDEEIAAGRYNPLDVSTIKKGDEIGSWAGWRKVLRVNAKTVSVESEWGGRHLVKIDEITGHRPAQPAAEALDLDAVQDVTP
jgi:hypothetical protein